VLNLLICCAAACAQCRPGSVVGGRGGRKKEKKKDNRSSDLAALHRIGPLVALRRRAVPFVIIVLRALPAQESWGPWGEKKKKKKGGGKGKRGRETQIAESVSFFAPHHSLNCCLASGKVPSGWLWLLLSSIALHDLPRREMSAARGRKKEGKWRHSWCLYSRLIIISLRCFLLSARIKGAS